MKKSMICGLVFLFAVGLVGTFLSNEVSAQIRPAYTKNVDEPGRTPWETRSQFLPNAGGCFGGGDCFNYTDGSSFAVFDLRPVPAGKRWVVTSATGAFAGGGTRTISLELGFPRGGIVFDGIKWAYGGPFSPGTFSGSTIFSANLFITFGPGETPFVRVSGTPNLGGYSVIVFSGYLIDANN